VSVSPVALERSSTLALESRRTVNWPAFKLLNSTRSVLAVSS
jgi:hypothetical protein